jgi:hypothetical protein
MFSNPLRFIRRQGNWKAFLVVGCVVAVLAAAGGWALAGAGLGRASTTALITTTTALRPTAHGGLVSNSRPQADAPRPGGGSANGKPGAATQTNGASPAPANIPGLVRISPGLMSVQLLPADPSHGATRSATGGGFTAFFSFGFTDQSHFNGAVAGTFTGNAEFRFKPPNPGDIHIRVDCLQFVGNNAYISGVSTNTAFGIAAGTEFLFGVEDDDSAPKPDMISDLFFSPGTHPFTCQTFHAPPHYSVQGNIEIH